MPAHDEAAVLRERLGGLMASLPPGAVEVVLVANGCSDDTADVARGIPGVRVLELTEASKSAALNAGDREATHFPRIYLDADIRIPGAAVLRLAAALDTDRPVVAAPRVDFDLSSCSWAVRAFFSLFRVLPYAGQGLVGLGVYGLSEAGRRRFDTFPDLVADDLYVQRLFAPEERLSVDASFQVVVPRRVRDLVAVRTRVARGNRQLAERAAELELATGSSTGGTARALLAEIVRRPYRLPAAVVYLGVTAVARSRARRAAPVAVWERDASSRSPVGAAAGSRR
jgi:glycosyltransferase involved in cell wall biosynthesis